jgi:hypothetical protein
MDEDAYKVCRLVGPRARQILDVFDLGAHGRADLSQQSPYLIEPLRGATPCRTAPGRGGARPRRLACAGPRRAHRRSTRAGRNPVLDRLLRWYRPRPRPSRGATHRCRARRGDDRADSARSPSTHERPPTTGVILAPDTLGHPQTHPPAAQASGQGSFLYVRVLGRARAMAIAGTCDCDSRVMPRISTNFSVRRVVTPCRWLVATRGGPGTLAPVRQPIQELGAGTPLGHRQFDRSGPRDPPRSIAVAGVRACTALRACAARRRPRQPRLTAFVGFRVLVLREIAGPHQGCVV